MPFFQVWTQIVAIDETREGKDNKQAQGNDVKLPSLSGDFTHDLLFYAKTQDQPNDKITKPLYQTHPELFVVVGGGNEDKNPLIQPGQIGQKHSNKE